MNKLFESVEGCDKYILLENEYPTSMSREEYINTLKSKVNKLADEFASLANFFNSYIEDSATGESIDCNEFIRIAQEEYPFENSFDEKAYEFSNWADKINEIK